MLSWGDSRGEDGRLILSGELPGTEKAAANRIKKKGKRGRAKARASQAPVNPQGTIALERSHIALLFTIPLNP
jgi:hypothetical protein